MVARRENGTSGARSASVLTAERKRKHSAGQHENAAMTGLLLYCMRKHAPSRSRYTVVGHQEKRQLTGRFILHVLTVCVSRLKYYQADFFYKHNIYPKKS